MESKAADPFVPANWVSHQASLPDLPIPPLSQSLDLFYDCVRPLVTQAELAEAKALGDELLGESGTALHKRLVEYGAKERGSGRSHIERFWTDAYLQPDDALVLNVNPFFVLEDDPTPHHSAETHQIERASSLIFSALKFVNVMRTAKMDPDVWRGVPLCMSQLHGFMFGAARIPKDGRDSIRVAPLAASRHVIVLCRQQFYSFDTDQTQMKQLTTLIRIPTLDQPVKEDFT